MLDAIKKGFHKLQLTHTTFIWLLCILGSIIVTASVLTYPDKFFAVISTLAGTAVSLVVFFVVFFGFCFFFLGTNVAVWDDILKGNRSLATFLGMLAIALALLVSRAFI